MWSNSKSQASTEKQRREMLFIDYRGTVTNGKVHLRKLKV